jgi:hypothetical protein
MPRGLIPARDPEKGVLVGWGYPSEPREFLETNKQAIYSFIDSAYRDYAKKEKGKAKAVLSTMGKDRGFWAMVYSTIYEIANPPKDV